MAILNVQNVEKTFDKTRAVQDLSFTINEGEVFGLLGPNGAGKTTTIRMIMDIIRPDKGEISLFGKPNSVALRELIGYLPEERGLYKKMKVMDCLLFFAEIKGVNPKSITGQAEDWLEKMELTKWRDNKVVDLSRGMQQKLQFICTVIHKPKLIILDEPFTGLDPVNTVLLKDVMLELKKEGTTIIFSTHLMEQVEKLCESICLINKGQNVLYGKLDQIKKQFGTNRIRMSYSGSDDFLNDKNIVASYDNYGQYVELVPAGDKTPNQVLKAVVDKVSVLEFKVTDPSLNEIFIKVVKNDSEAS